MSYLVPKQPLWLSSSVRSSDRGSRMGWIMGQEKFKEDKHVGDPNPPARHHIYGQCMEVSFCTISKESLARETRTCSPNNALPNLFLSSTRRKGELLAIVAIIKSWVAGEYLHTLYPPISGSPRRSTGFSVTRS